MQAVLAIPEFAARISEQEATEILMRPVAGIPLLMRTVLLAVRAGANDIVLICPSDLSDGLVQQFTASAQVRYGVGIKLIRSREFNPRASSSWTILKRHLSGQFLWLPWNWVTTKQFLTNLQLQSMASVDWARPARTTLHEMNRDYDLPFPPRREGVAVTSPGSVERAERFLVAYSGKVLDGIHTSFNRRLCRPFVRLLSHTSVTPNAVTFGGILISVLSAIAFAHGSYLYSVLGAFLFYIAGLFDEMDGMLARIKFAESPRGTWLEGFADGLSYLLLFGGITIGLSHRYGRFATLMGILLLVGAILALVTTSLQRRRATTADRPNEYLGRMYQLLDRDSSNWISRCVRQLQAFVRRGILVHYILLFTIIGALPLIFVLATLGANLTWILTLYFNRRFFGQSARRLAKENVNTFGEAL